MELAKDRNWLAKMSNAICEHWQKKNAGKKNRFAGLNQPPGALGNVPLN